MVRISICHLNKYGPLKFPAVQTQVFFEDSKVPKLKRKEFYFKVVSKWLSKNDDRQLFEWHKDLVGNDAIPDGSKKYVAHKDVVMPVAEEEL